MAHKFDRSRRDPYVEAAHQVERNVFSGRSGYEAGASEEVYGRLGDAVVTALGDIAAEAFRLGVSQPSQVQGLAKAVAASAERIILAYQGEVDPEPALSAIASDPRAASLGEVAREKLTREIEKTRQLELLLLNAMRLPALLDYAGSLGLHDHEDAIDQGTLLVSTHPTPNPEQP